MCSRLNKPNQGELFNKNSNTFFSGDLEKELNLSFETIENWQEKIYLHQEKLLHGLGSRNQQTTLFSSVETNEISKLCPLRLTALPLNFWRWTVSPHKGPAIYIVMDKLKDQNKNIILYIGETISAEKRWKGEHDCKLYLSNYSESLQKAGLKCQLNIRFWLDVPKETHLRRKLEQKLIQAWLPPFNKETRDRWATPFTSQIY